MKLKEDKGFTLVDLSIALIVISLLAVPILQEYNNYIQTKAFTESSSNQITINAAIEEFYLENGRYPCPADPTLKLGDAGYGNEDCSGTNLNVPVVNAFEQDGTSAINNNGMNGQDKVLIGAVPFMTLKIKEAYTFDGHKNKITYAVTKFTTVVGEFNPDAAVVGSILLFRADGSFTLAQNQYVLISHGEDGLGAYSSAGVLVAACPLATAEGENCDNDSHFYAEEGARSLVTGANYYDDQLISTSSFPERTWEYDDTNENSITSIRGRTFGIGTETPDTNVFLDVDGNIRVTDAAGDGSEGKIESVNLCVVDPTSPDCFSPDVIGGNGIACPNNVGMTGISHANTECNVSYVAGTTGTCPAGQLMTGLDAGGNIICAAP